MSKLVSQHTAYVRENHPVFPPGLVYVSVYQADAGHYYVRVNGAIVANYMTRQVAENYFRDFIYDVSGLGLFDRIKALRNRLDISLIASKHICEANLDGLIANDYIRDIELLAAHLRKD